MANPSCCIGSLSLSVLQFVTAASWRFSGASAPTRTLVVLGVFQTDGGKKNVSLLRITQHPNRVLKLDSIRRQGYAKRATAAAALAHHGQKHNANAFVRKLQ